VSLSFFFQSVYEAVLLMVCTGECRHEGREPVEDSGEISNEQADEESPEIVERWVSAHMVPVSFIWCDNVLYTTMLTAL
jgi:hypothetical protein